MANEELVKDIQESIVQDLIDLTHNSLLADFNVLKTSVLTWNKLYEREPQLKDDDNHIKLTEGIKKILPLGAYILNVFRSTLVGRDITFAIAPTYLIDINGVERVSKTSLKNEISFREEKEVLISFINERLKKGSFTSDINISEISKIGKDLSELDKDTIDVIYLIIIRERVQFIQSIYNNNVVNDFETYYISPSINPKFSTNDMINRDVSERVYMRLKNSTRQGTSYWRNSHGYRGILIQKQDGYYRAASRNDSALYAVAELGGKRVALAISGNEGHYFEALLHGASSLIQDKNNLKTEYDIVEEFIQSKENYMINKHISILDAFYKQQSKSKNVYNVDQANIAAHGNTPFYSGADVNFKLYSSETKLNNNLKIISLLAKRQNASIKGGTIILGMKKLNSLLENLESGNVKDRLNLVKFFTDNTLVGLSKEIDELDRQAIDAALKVILNDIKKVKSK